MIIKNKILFYDSKAEKKYISIIISLVITIALIGIFMTKYIDYEYKDYYEDLTYFPDKYLSAIVSQKHLELLYKIFEYDFEYDFSYIINRAVFFINEVQNKYYSPDYISEIDLINNFKMQRTSDINSLQQQEEITLFIDFLYQKIRKIINLQKEYLHKDLPKENLKYGKFYLEEQKRKKFINIIIKSIKN